MDADERWMQRAIEIARRGIAAGQSPFGAVVTRGDELVAEAHNAVIAETDPTSHAEVRAIRAASRALGTIDLSECVLYSTCEPCPMCFGAIHWARIGLVVYGTSIADAKRAGFNELPVSNETLKRLGRSRIGLSGGFLRPECLDLFKRWKASPKKRRY